MDKTNLINKVVEIYFRDNCTAAEALDMAKKELDISSKDNKEEI